MTTPSQSTTNIIARIAAMKKAGAYSESHVREVMEALQQIGRDDADAACSLMADLWPLASEIYMHDVCDSIDLWIDDHRSPAVISKLTELSVAHSDLGVRKHWLDLLGTT